jgi:hypothetical protein
LINRLVVYAALSVLSLILQPVGGQLLHWFNNLPEPAEQLVWWVLSLSFYAEATFLFYLVMFVLRSPRPLFPIPFIAVSSSLVGLALRGWPVGWLFLYFICTSLISERVERCTIRIAKMVHDPLSSAQWDG